MRKLLFAVTMLTMLAGASCARAPEQTPDVVAVLAANVPADPDDPAWASAPERTEKLLLQDLVEPRQMKVSTPEVRVRAIASQREIAFRLEWPDAVVDDLPGNGRFVDGCAIQLPLKADANAPDPQMGQPDKAVQITFWRADWQATVDGRGTAIQDLYPNATVDHYPYEATPLEPGSDAQKEMARRYAPAEAAGNLRGGPRSSPVEDLVAEGPGTLVPAGATTARGRGVHTGRGWSVVITRPLPDGLAPGTRTQVALAVWEGAAKEAGARKMRSGWVGLSIRGTS